MYSNTCVLIPVWYVEDYVRVDTVHGKVTELHWLYSPDSYNIFVPSADIKEPPVDTPLPGPPFLVTTQWISDLELYNEWMDEKDYEVIFMDDKLLPMLPHLGESIR